MALTLQQIVDMADLNTQNTDTDANKVTFLDQLQRTLYRKFKFPEKIDQIDTVADQGLYSLPSYLKPDRIISVVITDSTGEETQEYTLVTGGDLPSYCYYTLNTDSVDLISIYPDPETTGDYIIITFEDGPNSLSSSDMTTTPRFFEDYHLLFVYALSAELAKRNRDIPLANNWTAEYNSLLEEAEAYINDDGRPFNTAAKW